MATEKLRRVILDRQKLINLLEHLEKLKLAHDLTIELLRQADRENDAAYKKYLAASNAEQRAWDEYSKASWGLKPKRGRFNE